MKRSHFFLLVLAAAVFAALGWHLHRSEKGSWQDTPLPPGAALAGEFPVNDVAEIRLRGPAGAVTLRRGDGGWIVAERAGYAADFDKVSALVRQLAGLKAVQDIPVADADLGRLELRAPGEGVPPEEAAVAVDLRDAQGGGFASLLLGKTHLVAPAGMPPEFGGTPAGRFVRSDKQPGRAYLVTETFADVQASPAAWIAPAYVRPGMARRIEVKGAGPDRSWAIERSAQGAAWNLPGRSAPADASAAMNIDSLFGGMAVADAPDGPDDARFKPLQETPVTVVADTFDGIRYTLTIGEGAGDNLPVKMCAEALGEQESGDAGKARDEKLAEAARFQDRAVFVPRKFVEPFLRPCPVVPPPAATPAPAPSPTPKPKKK